MKKARKVIALTLCAVMLVVGSVAGTMAYLTSTDTVVNTFTVGNVDITLDEAKVNPDGNYVTDHNNRVKENDYHLLPGHTYIKDPTVTVKEGSEKSYIRMLVTINEQADLDAIFAPNGLPLTSFFGGVSEFWTLVSESEDELTDTRTYEFRYFAPAEAPDNDKDTNEDVVLDDLFETITVPGELTKEQLKTIEGLEIKVVAQAIQADGFATADAAWEAFSVSAPALISE